MDEVFDLPIIYNGKELLFPARLLQLGYTHKFAVMVGDTEVFFEPDEERNYRALVDPDNVPKNLDAALLHAIAQAIEEILK